MVRIADQSLMLGIHDEVEQLQRNVADEDRTLIRNRRDIDRTKTPLDRQPDRPKNAERCKSGSRLGATGPDLFDTEFLNESLGHSEQGCLRIDLRIGYFNTVDLIIADLSSTGCIEIKNVLDLGRNDHFAHRGCLHLSDLTS